MQKTAWDAMSAINLPPLNSRIFVLFRTFLALRHVKDIILVLPDISLQAIVLTLKSSFIIRILCQYDVICTCLQIEMLSH